MPSQAAQSARSAPSLARAPKKGDHVFLVDGSSYIFRAYHALPPLNRKSDGLQVNAVLGFCNMLWKLLRDMKPEERPTHLAVVFDKSERTFRTEMLALYSAYISVRNVLSDLSNTTARWVGRSSGFMSRKSFHSMLQKPSTALTCRPSDLRLSGGSA